MYAKQQKHVIPPHIATLIAQNNAMGSQSIPLVLVPVVHALGVGCTHDDQLVNEAAVGVGYQPGDDPAPIMCY